MSPTNEEFVRLASQCVLASNNSYRYAFLLGTNCSNASIVPIPLKDSSVESWPILPDMLFDLWIRCSQPNSNLPPYQIYSQYTNDDEVTWPTRFVIVHEPQNVVTTEVNEYISTLTFQKAIPWQGNVLIFKMGGRAQILHANMSDISFVKCLAAMYDLHFK